MKCLCFLTWSVECSKFNMSYFISLGLALLTHPHLTSFRKVPNIYKALMQKFLDQKARTRNRVTGRKDSPKIKDTPVQILFILRHTDKVNIAKIISCIHTNSVD